MVNELWKDNKDSVGCALAAPTGLAAFNIDGVTVHRLIQLTIEHDSKTLATSKRIFENDEKRFQTSFLKANHY